MHCTRRGWTSIWEVELPDWGADEEVEEEGEKSRQEKKRKATGVWNPTTGDDLSGQGERDRGTNANVL
jgi:hypothetical protein